MALHYELRPDEDLLAMSMSREALRLARTMQTTHSGSLWIPNGDGTGTLIGPGAGTDENGRPNGMQQFMGDLTAPPPPKGVTASCDNGILIVAWDGTLEEATPPDFDRIRIIVRPDGGGPQTLGDLTAAGTIASGLLADGEWTVWAIAIDVQGNESDESARVTVTVRDPMGDAQDRLDELGDRADQFAESLGKLEQGVGGSITSTREEYATGTRYDPPGDDAAWAATPPAATGSLIVWRRTVTVTADGTTTISEPVPLTGESAASVEIVADGGTVVRNSRGATTLRATVIYGSERLSDMTSIRAAFGPTATVSWSELPYAGEWTDVPPSDPRLSADGLALTATAAGLRVQSTFMARLEAGDAMNSTPQTDPLTTR